MATDVAAEDLKVEEVNVTSAVLLAGASHYEKHCKKINEKFMNCRIDTKDPRKCLSEGREVTKCALEFFRIVKGTCHEPFTEYWTCLDYNNQKYRFCRKPQKVFDQCMAGNTKSQPSQQPQVTPDTQ